MSDLVEREREFDQLKTAVDEYQEDDDKALSTLLEPDSGIDITPLMEKLYVEDMRHESLEQLGYDKNSIKDLLHFFTF